MKNFHTLENRIEITTTNTSSINLRSIIYLSSCIGILTIWTENSIQMFKFPEIMQSLHQFESFFNNWIELYAFIYFSSHVPRTHRIRIPISYRILLDWTQSFKTKQQNKYTTHTLKLGYLDFSYCYECFCMFTKSNTLKSIFWAIQWLRKPFSETSR